MDAYSALLNKLDQYLAKELDLSGLVAWVDTRLPTYMLNPDSPSSQLAGAIELLTSEVEAGLRSERSVRTLLSKYQAKPTKVRVSTRR
jgi:hypothetical protein